MREMWIGNQVIVGQGGALTCDYIVLAEESGGDICCERYGIRVALRGRDEVAEVMDITLNADRILELGNLLCRNGVTPCTLRDIIEDWL